jgi:hypothetical protein
MTTATFGAFGLLLVLCGLVVLRAGSANRKAVTNEQQESSAIKQSAASRPDAAKSAGLDEALERARESRLELDEDPSAEP